MMVRAAAATRREGERRERTEGEKREKRREKDDNVFLFRFQKRAVDSNQKAMETNSMRQRAFGDHQRERASARLR